MKISVLRGRLVWKDSYEGRAIGYGSLQLLQGRRVRYFETDSEAAFRPKDCDDGRFGAERAPCRPSAVFGLKCRQTGPSAGPSKPPMFCY